MASSASAELRQPVRDFVPDVLVPVAGVNLEVLFEQLNDGQIGQRCAIGVTAAVEPGVVNVCARVWRNS